MLISHRYVLAWLLTAAIFCGSGAAALRGQTIRATHEATAMFRNGPTHSGVYHPAGARFGGLQWRFQTGGAVRSSPTVAGGTVYVGSSDGHLYAIDARTGVLRWRHNARSPVTSTPAVMKGLVYVNTYDGRMLALNALSGKAIWELKTGANAPLAWGYESGDFYTSSPTVVDGKVIFGAGDGFLYAAQATTGRVVWKTQTGGRIRSSPAVQGETVFCGSFDGRLYAVDLRNGQIRWRYETEGVRLNSADFGYDRKSIQSSPAVADNTVFFGARDGFLYAVAADSGQLRWRFDHEISWVNTSPAVAESVVYAGSSDGRFVQGVDARTGKEVWRLKTDNLVWSSPTVAGQTLYLGDWGGTLYAIDRSNGKELWRYHAQRRILSSPVVDGNRLYFGSDDGNVYAINLTQGEALHRVVFWDADYVKGASFRGHEALRDYFKERGYAVLNDEELKDFINERLRNRAPSVVVFAIDHLPPSVSEARQGLSLLRKYLNEGGKVVWVGMPPLLWPRDLRSGQREIKGIARGATEDLLGVGHRRGNFDLNSASATAAGMRWGMQGWWLSNWSADPASVTTVLAQDEHGLAAAWVRRYTNVEGTGFIRMPMVETANGTPANLFEIKTVAEYFPK